MDLGEVGWGDVDWTGLAQDRNRWRALVNSVLNLRVVYNILQSINVADSTNYNLSHIEDVKKPKHVS
jgi:hypothetical protein